MKNTFKTPTAAAEFVAELSKRRTEHRCVQYADDSYVVFTPPWPASILQLSYADASDAEPGNRA